MKFLLLVFLLGGMMWGQSWRLGYWNDKPISGTSQERALEFVRSPSSLWPASHGGFYVADSADFRIKEVFANGFVRAFAGVGFSPEGFRVGSRPGFEVPAPQASCIDGQGRMWFRAGNNGFSYARSDGRVTEFLPLNNQSLRLTEGPVALTERSWAMAQLTCDTDGFAYAYDFYSAAIYRVDGNGIAVRVTGTGLGADRATESATPVESLATPLSSVFGMAWHDQKLYILESEFVQRIDLRTRTKVTMASYADRFWSTGPAGVRGPFLDQDRLLFLEGRNRVGALPLNTTGILRATDRLPQTVLDLTAIQNVAHSLARLTDGSYVVATMTPPNVYRSWNGTWVPVLGAKHKEERLPMDWVDQAVFEPGQWAANGEFMGNLITGKGQPSLYSGYYPGDDFVSVYHHSGPDLNYANYSGQQFKVRDHEGSWIFGSSTETALKIRRLNENESSELPAQWPGSQGKANQLWTLTDGTLVARRSAELFRRDRRSTAMVPISGLGKSTIEEGPANQTAVGSLPATMTREGKMVTTQLVSGGYSFQMFEVDVIAGSVRRLAGATSGGSSADGVPALEARLEPTFNALNCGSAGYLYRTEGSEPGLNRIRQIGSDGRIRTILNQDLSAPNGTLGDALRTTANVYSMHCWPDGMALIGNVQGTWATRELLPPGYVRLKKAAGDEQYRFVGGELPQPLRVQVTREGQPLGGRRVTFQLVRGEGTLSATEAMTDGAGRAEVRLRLGQVPGTVWVEAGIDTGAKVMFRNWLRYPLPSPPSIAAGGIVSAGLSVPAIQRLVPGGIATIFGQGLSGVSRVLTSNDVVNGQLPDRLGDVCVEVDGLRAALFAVFPNQINFQVPALAPGREVDVRVIRGCETPFVQTSDVRNVILLAAAPEFFYLSYRVDGANPVIAADAGTGAVGPVRPGQWITLYATGLGPVEPGVAPGSVARGASRITLPFGLRIAGRNLEVAYVGVAPGTAGQYQINVQLPADLLEGVLPIQMTVGGVASPLGPTIEVRR